MTQAHYDCVIIGSGLIGITAAIALAKKMPWRIALLDEKIATPITQQQKNVTLDTRTLALNAASVAYFEQLDIWPECEPYACAMKHIHVSEEKSWGSCLLSATDVGYEALGYVIEINLLYTALLKKLSEQTHVQTYQGIRVNHLNKQESIWHIDLAEKQLTAQTVILADGTESRLRTQLSIACSRFDYQQTAIVAAVQIEQPHQHTAYERFAEKEILAVLPLTQNRMGTVLTVPQSMQDHYLAMTDAEYLKKLQTLFGFRLGAFQALGPRQSYPLQQCIAEQFVDDQLILLGNTAHTMNPLGAQGLNLGLAGIKDLVCCLAGNESLAQFDNRQQARCEKIKKFTHETARIFSSPALLTRLGRQAALFALQHQPTLKNTFMRRMMGLSSQ